MFSHCSHLTRSVGCNITKLDNNFHQCTHLARIFSELRTNIPLVSHPPPSSSYGAWLEDHACLVVPAAYYPVLKITLVSNEELRPIASLSPAFLLHMLLVTAGVVDLNLTDRTRVLMAEAS